MQNVKTVKYSFFVTVFTRGEKYLLIIERLLKVIKWLKMHKLKSEQAFI